MAKDLDAMKEMFQSGKYVPFVMRGVLLQWARHLNEPDTEFDKVGKYKVNCIIDAEIAEEMRTVGFNVKKNKDDEEFVVPTRKPEHGKCPIVDSSGDAIDATKIGNGTIADVHVKAKYYPKLDSLAIYLEKVEVLDLVEYDGVKAEFGG